MTTRALLMELRHRKVSLWLDNGEIRYRAHSKELTPEILGTLKNRKEELRALLVEKSFPFPSNHIGSDEQTTKTRKLETSAVSIDTSHRFLARHIEIIPLGHCKNPMTYFVRESILYEGYRRWCLKERISPLSAEGFHDHLVTLFPEPHAKFHPRVFQDGAAVSQWTGFRYVSGGVN